MKHLEVSIDEADTMITKLNTEIDTLETLKKGELPEAPVIPPTPLNISEPEIKVVEVSTDIWHNILTCQRIDVH